MENSLEELSRRVIRCTNWRWMPGMKDMEGWRLYREVVGFTAQDKDGKTVTGWDAIGGEWEYHQVAHFPKLPDLSDPATLGCLLTLVREAWGQSAWCQFEDGEWNCFVIDNEQLVYFIGSTEAKALVKALENKP